MSYQKQNFEKGQILTAEHLNNIDMLKDSIGLVAYGQKDPLIEYKKEAYNLFNALMAEIQGETVRHIFRARFGVQIIEG